MGSERGSDVYNPVTPVQESGIRWRIVVWWFGNSVRGFGAPFLEVGQEGSVS